MAAVSTHLRVGIGTSTAGDARGAATEAATTALAGVDGARPELVLAYVSDTYHLVEVLAAIIEVTGEVPLAGASAGSRVLAGSDAPQSLAVLVLAGGDYSFHVSHVTGVTGRAEQAGRELIRAARVDRWGGHEAFLLFSDATIGDQQGLLVGVYQVAGFAAPIFGGVAGSVRTGEPEIHYGPRSFVFDGGHAYTDAAVAVRIGSPQPLRVALGQGWHPTGMPSIVTDVDGNILREVGGQSALNYFIDGYRRIDIDSERSPVAKDWVHALGLIQADGSLLIRSTYLDADNAVRTFSPVPQYAAVQTVYSEPEEVLAVGEATMREALADRDAAVVLAFDCVSRLDILGDAWPHEAQRLQAAAGPVPVFALPSFGEFARLTSVAGFHNASIVAVAL